jgi:hypothetical protein
MRRASLMAMTSTTSFRNLEVWQESMMLVEETYAISKSFPRDELFGLTAQVRKAAVSIPSNIGEGARRKIGFSSASSASAECSTASFPLSNPKALDLVPGRSWRSLNLEPGT